MYLASILTICLQLGAAPSGLPRTIELAAYRPEAQKRQSYEAVSLSQTGPPTTGQNTQPPAPASPPASPGSAQTASQPSTSPSSKKKNPATSASQRKQHRKPHSKPRKVVVRNGSTTDPSVQFSTTASPEQATHERQSTAGLLATAQANLQKLSGHHLSSSQQDMVTQIRGYMRQAKSAEDAGDLQSAQNLALKAQLLSSDLVRK